MKRSSVGPPRNLSDQIAAILSDDMLFRRIAPGAPLRESQLCARFHVSRPAIRDALNQLAAMGQVEFLPRKGARAVDFTPAELEDIIGFHAVVFAHTCRLAAERRSEAEMRDIHESIDHLSRLADSSANAEEYEAARQECYAAIERAIGSAYALNRRRPFITRLWNPYAIAAVATSEMRRASAARWRKLGELIAAQDGRAAEGYFFAMVECTRRLMIEACLKARQHQPILARSE